MHVIIIIIIILNLLLLNECLFPYFVLLWCCFVFVCISVHSLYFNIYSAFGKAELSCGFQCFQLVLHQLMKYLFQFICVHIHKN